MIFTHAIDLKRLRMSGRGTSILRDINEVLVLNIIRERQPTSRAAIAEISGLEPGTVTRILQRFVQNRIVNEAGIGPSSSAGGRRPRYVTLNEARQGVIGVEIGTRQTLLALSDLNGQIQDYRRVPNSPDPGTTLERVADEIQSLLDRTTVYEEFGGVGVGLVGLIDGDEGVILEGQHLGWPGPVKVGEYFRSRIPGIPFYFENNARLSALGEMWFGSSHLRGVEHLVLVRIGEGIGAGIIVDGHIYRGHGHGAGEFGHVCIDPSGPECSCGGRGCLEAMASDKATIQRYIKRVGGGDGGTIDMQFVVDLANRGDACAQSALKETAHYLGLGLAPIIYGISPEVIIVAGTIVQAWPLIEESIHNGAAERVSRPFLKNIRIERSAMQMGPSLMGAISFVLAHSFAGPELFRTR